MNATHHNRRLLRTNGAELRNRDLVLGQNLEQIRFERFVGTIELVNQQNGCDTVLGCERLQQRALQQETGCEYVVRQLAALDAARSLSESYLDHLTRIVPFINSRGGVEPLIALKAHQTTPESSGQDFRDLGFAYAGFAFEKKRSRHVQ